jgi:hypothetical protein
LVLEESHRHPDSTTTIAIASFKTVYFGEFRILDNAGFKSKYISQMIVKPKTLGEFAGLWWIY